MRRAMEYVRWELDNWQNQTYGSDMSIFTETKKVASYMWQSWRRGALLVLLMAFLPILFPLVLFLSFLGFISAVPLLCGAAGYYLIFRSFSLPSSVIELFNPPNHPSEGLITRSQPAEGRMLQSVPFVVQEAVNRQEFQSMTCATSVAGTEDPERLSNANTIMLLECELVGIERDEADNCEHHSTFELSIPSEGESRAGSSSFIACRPNAVLQFQGPILLLPSAKLKNQCEQRKDEGAQPSNGTRDEFMAEALKREVADVSSNELSKSSSGKAPASVMMVLEEANAVEAKRTCAHSSPTVTSAEINYPVQGCGSAEFSLGKSFPPGEAAAHVISPLSEKSEACRRVSGVDVPVRGILEEGCSIESVCEAACITERRHTTEVHGVCDRGACHGRFIVEGYGGLPTAESVFFQHTVTVAPSVESSETSDHIRGHGNGGKRCPAGNRALAGIFEVNTEASVSSTPIPFSDTALLTTPEVAARADSESVLHSFPARYWRDEVEDTVGSSALARVASMENRISGASGDMASQMSWNTESEKMTMSDQDVASLLKCAGETEVFLHTPNSGRYEERTVEGENRTGSSLRIAISLFTHQRRLSFSNVLADEEMASPEVVQRTKLNEFTTDCKKRSVSTSFSSDYTWPSESSEQGFEFLSTRGTAYEDSCVDTASSTAQHEEESDLEPGVVSDPSFFPTPDHLTEDWETRRKRWEEESTLGRLTPLSPYMEPRSVEARSMCNPLFEFSTPSPPLKKLNTGDKNYISNSPSSHTRFSKRNSAPPEISLTQTWSSGSTLSPRQLRIQECKSDLYDEQLESSTRHHARSYSASFTESLEPYSGEFEGLLGYWWRRDKTAHSLTSSPRHSPTATSPAEIAHRLRKEIDAIQTIIGQEIPPQFSLWKEVENLSQIIGMKLPYMGDMSDMIKARQGLDLLKVAVCSRWDVEL